MSIFFDDTEVIKIAERVEQNGAAFYRKAAEHYLVDGSLKKKFLELAVIEDAHEAKFASIRKKRTNPKLERVVYDPYHEAVAYLQAVADGHVFKIDEDYSNLIDNKMTMEEILKIAIGFERDSIAFYIGMVEMLSGKTDREILNTLIREEMSHVSLLSGELMSLKNKR